MATKYDMHVYTMGTRAYAEEVCAAIDPDGSVFKGRILSRDESGSESVEPGFGARILNPGRLNAEEFTTTLSMRYFNGCHYRRPSRRLGMESQLNQGHPM